MSFQDDNERKIGQFAGGSQFYTWKDYSYPTVRYWLPAGEVDPLRHPTLDEALSPGAIYYNTDTGITNFWDGETWRGLITQSSFLSLPDTPDDWDVVNTVLKSNGVNAAVWGQVSWNELAGVPSTFPPSNHSHTSPDLPASIAYKDRAEVITGAWGFTEMPDIGNVPIVPPGGSAGQVLAKATNADFVAFFFPLFSFLPLSLFLFFLLSFLLL